MMCSSSSTVTALAISSAGSMPNARISRLAAVSNSRMIGPASRR